MDATAKNSYFTFGQFIDGLTINGRPAPYRVLNEREMRVTAGLKMAMGAFAFANAFFAKNFTFLEVAVASFFVEFVIKVFFGPTLAPYSMLGRFLVRKQEPEWVGATQKRFAWSIGLLMSIAMVFIVIVFQIRGPLPFTLCALCVTLMWFEACAGICVGCTLYWWTVKLGLLPRPDYAPACPGDSCQLD